MLPVSSRAPDHGTIAVVTGAGSGLGRALAIELCRRGMRVAGFGRRIGPLEETATLAGEGFIPVAVDIGDDQAVHAAFETLRRDTGDISVLINNAAVHPRMDFLKETYATFMDTFAVNLGGVFSCTKAALSGMTLSGFGRIVNVGSFADLSPQPGSAAYSVSKGSARVLSQAIVADLADRFPDIVISTWMPGILATEMGRPDGLDPSVAARWGVQLALWNDRSLNGAVFEGDHEILESRSLKRRVRDRLLFKHVPAPRKLEVSA